MLRLLPILAVLWLLLTGAASGKALHTAEPPPGNFLLQLSEASSPDALKTREGIRESDPFGYECMPGDAYCHNDPINKVDVLGLREVTVVSPDPLNRFRRNADGEWEVRMVTQETGFWGNRADFVRDAWEPVSKHDGPLGPLAGYVEFNEQGGSTTRGAKLIVDTAAATGWDRNAKRDLTLIGGGSMTALLAAPYAVASSPAWGTAAYVNAGNLTAAGMAKIGTGATLLQQGYQRAGPLLTRVSHSPTLHSIASDGAHSYAIRPGSMGGWWQSYRLQPGSVINPFFKGSGPQSLLGRVTGHFDAIKPGSLSDELAGTFAGGRYNEVILDADTILYRAGKEGRPLGQFFSTEVPEGILQTRIDKAVLPVWSGGGTSPIDAAFGIKIPAGTKVFTGNVSTQGGVFVGGTPQVVVPKPWLIEGVEHVLTLPLR